MRNCQASLPSLARRLSIGLFVGSIFLCTLSSEVGQADERQDGARSVSLPQASKSDKQQTTTLNFGDEVDIRRIVDYVAARTGRSFLYDASLSGTVSLRTPQEIPVDALYRMLESILEFKGLALVPSPGGFIKVVPAGVARTKPTLLFGPDEVDRLPDEDIIVTQVVQLKYVDPGIAVSALNPLLSGGAGPPVAGRGRAGATPSRAAVALGTKVVAVPEHRLLIITDYAPNVRRIVKLVATLDLKTEADPHSLALIRLQHIRADEYAPKILGYVEARYAQAGRKDYVLPLVDHDRRLNSLIVAASSEDMKMVRTLVQELDVEVPAAELPYRIICLENSNAEEMLGTLKEVMSAEREAGSDVVAAPTATTVSVTAARTHPGRTAPASGPKTTTPSEPVSAIAGTSVSAIANRHTNSIILIGPPKEQEMLAAIIEHLDKRRPQVMIEALVMEVDADKTFDIGVELANLQPFTGDRVGGATSFGLSKIDFTKGTIDIGSGFGLSGFLIHGGDVRAIVRLFEQKVQARIVSQPRALVNDNETAAFSSEREEPFIQINALGADTTAVSFGGYETAGTTLNITPHISQADYLQLEIEITLSAFQGEGSTDLPPPRTTSSLYSKVTVPDNSTVLLGGLNRTDERETVSKVPLLGDIPVIGRLFRRDTTVKSEATLYVFVTARIARAEDFSDLEAMAREASRQLIRQDGRWPGASEPVAAEEDVLESSDSGAEE